MTDRDDRLKTARQLAQRQGSHAVPSAELFVPELRSELKWVPSGAPPPILPEEAVMVVWRYGVRFVDVEGFHGWLAANEFALAGDCAALTNNEVHYLGTYLHVDTGSSRYETFWGFKVTGNSTEAAEDLLEDALRNNAQFRSRVNVLRGYWVRDAGATDHRYGMAALYLNFGPGGADSPFWERTLDARGEQAQ